jgi:hypothetical protein
LIRADVSTRRQRFILQSVGKHLMTPLPSIPTQLDDVCTHLPLSDQWAVDKCWHSDNGCLVADAIKDGSALAISNGLYKNERGTSAFLLQGPSKEQGRIIGVNRTPGNPSNQSPYRTELSGISGILATLSILCQIYQISSGAVRIGLDGNSAMKESSGAHPLNPAQPSFDLLADIHAKNSWLPLKLSFFWVEGHQYERHGFVSYLGTLDDICDSLTKQHWNDSIPLGTRPAQCFGDEQFSVSIDSSKLSQLNKTELYDASYGRTRSIPYWQERQHLNDEEIQAINWPALALAMAPD